MSPRLKRAVLLLVCVALFTTGKVFLGRSQTGSGRLQTSDAPNSVFGYLAFGAVRPLFLNYLWSKADRLQQENRFWELIDVQERIVRLEPNDKLVRSRQIKLIAFGVAQSEPDDTARWRYYRRALRKLQDAIDLHPDDFELRELRFYILFNLIAPDRYCSRQLEQKTGRTGLMAALAEAVTIVRDFPDLVAAYDIRLRATEEACEWLVNRGRLEQGAVLLDELAVMAGEFEKTFPGEPHRKDWQENYRGWADRLRRLAGLADWKKKPWPTLKDGPALESLLADLESQLGTEGALRLDPDVETTDGALVNYIHLRALGLCQSMVLAKNNAASLRYLRRINRISHLAEGRIGPRMPYYSVAYVNLFETFVGLDAERNAALQAGNGTAQLDERWRSELQKLEQLIRERAGRTDSFRDRLIETRR